LKRGFIVGTLYLDPKAAYNLAEELTAIPFAPSRNAAVEGIARELIRLCHGGNYRGEPWSPERQARWVVEEAYNWENWHGPAGIRQIFYRRFAPQPASGPVRLQKRAVSQASQKDLFDEEK
jgi:hypothetical protein